MESWTVHLSIESAVLPIKGALSAFHGNAGRPAGGTLGRGPLRHSVSKDAGAPGPGGADHLRIIGWSRRHAKWLRGNLHHPGVPGNIEPASRLRRPNRRLRDRLESGGARFVATAKANAGRAAGKIGRIAGRRRVLSVADGPRP